MITESAVEIPLVEDPPNDVELMMRALKISETRYRRLFETAKDGILILNADTGMIEEVNPYLMEMLGYSHEEFLGKNLWEIGSFKDIDESKSAFEELQNREYIRYEDLPLETKDGRRMDVEFVSNVYKANGKKVIQCNIRDITERKRIEKELAKGQKLESVGVLAGGIAHDFNNLLTTILGNITFAKTYLSPEDKIFILLDEAEKASIRASDLTKQLITFSKGGGPFKKITSIGKLIKDTVQFTLSGSNIKSEFNIPDDLWLVEVDEGQIKQVIYNMVLNARECMPGGGVVHILTENILNSGGNGLPLKEGEYIKVSIEDQGSGIPEENLSKVFDPYFSTKERGGQRGMGLGLTVCYSVVKNHHGLITLESEMGVGTTFHIYLPVLRKEVLEKPSVSKGKILIMDDEEGVRKIAGTILRHIGYEVDYAREGAEAIELYRRAKEFRQSFDGVILDLTIRGGMGGKETIERLLEIDSEVKAIISSAYSDDPAISEFKEYGFRGAVIKPFTIEQLSEAVDGMFS